LTAHPARQQDELKKEISSLKGQVAQRDEIIQQHKRELNTASQDKRELLEVVEKRDKQVEILTEENKRLTQRVTTTQKEFSELQRKYHEIDANYISLQVRTRLSHIAVDDTAHN